MSSEGLTGAGGPTSVVAHSRGRQVLSLLEGTLPFGVGCWWGGAADSWLVMRGAAAGRRVLL